MGLANKENRDKIKANDYKRCYSLKNIFTGEYTFYTMEEFDEIIRNSTPVPPGLEEAMLEAAEEFQIRRN